MASCDDDFSLLGDDPHSQLNPPHHIQPPYASHRFSAKPSPPIQPPPLSPKKLAGPDPPESADDYAESAFHDVNPFPADDTSNPFNPAGSDPGKSNARGDKRKSMDDLSDDGITHASFRKKPAGGSAAAAEYRKDREEWSDAAISCLLDAYTEKFLQLNRGNLRGRDWEEVAATVSERCDKQSKSVEQCKNKVDNLKKRYKLERHRMTNGSVSASHWPWFKKMEEIVGNSQPSKSGNDDEKPPVTSLSSTRQSKRYTAATPSPTGPLAIVKAKTSPTPRWRRVIFKISGAALCGNGPNNIDPKVPMLIAREVAMACRVGVEVAIVVGGSNFFCGESWVTATGLERCTAYQIGMMATVMNSVLLQSALEKMGIQSRVQSAFPMQEVAEPYSRQRAIRHLEKGRVVIFGGIGAGPGNPLFSTDTAAALRASEIHAESLVKGTNVDGVYDCNSQDSNVTFEHISFRELAARGATSMDVMALTFCEDNGIPVVVFNLLNPGNITRALCGEQVGTLIDQAGRV